MSTTVDFEADFKDAFEKLAQDDSFAAALWSALANVTWYHTMSGEPYSCSFRYAGGLIAELRGKGESYMDFYCCAPDGLVDDTIRRALKKRGWIFDNTPAICDEPGCLNDAGCGWPSPLGYRVTCSQHYVSHEDRENCAEKVNAT